MEKKDSQSLGDEKRSNDLSTESPKEQDEKIKAFLVAIQNNTHYHSDNLLIPLLPVIDTIRPGSLTEIVDLGINEIRLSQRRYSAGTNILVWGFWINKIVFVLSSCALIFLLYSGKMAGAVAAGIIAAFSTLFNRGKTDPSIHEQHKDIDTRTNQKQAQKAKHQKRR